MLEHQPDQKQVPSSLPDTVLDGGLLLPFGLDSFFSYYYYPHAGYRAVAKR